MLKLRPCERRNIPIFVFSQNLKNVLFSIFRKYEIYYVKIVFRETRDYSKNVRCLTFNLNFEVKKRMF